MGILLRGRLPPQPPLGREASPDPRQCQVNGWKGFKFLGLGIDNGTIGEDG